MDLNGSDEPEHAHSRKLTSSRKELANCMLVIEEITRIHQMNTILLGLLAALIRRKKRRRRLAIRGRCYPLSEKIPAQVRHLSRLVGVTDKSCLDNLRMDRNSFGRLCQLLRDASGLIDQRFVKVEEQVAMFLCILAHHKKTRIIGFDFIRSSHTVSRYMHVVLQGVLRLHERLLATPEPIGDECSDNRWRWFPGCLGALDGTHINVRCRVEDTPRYRNRKGQIATNTLAVCDRFMRFVYVLPGWEGSAGDSRILRDAVTREDGFKVPKGCYYLCDNGYANCEGFLTPFKGVRYHLKEWGPACQHPQTPKEIFNMRHTKARNVIERAFAVLKMRWGILRSASFYPMEVQTRLIIACFLLHNFIRGQMEVDPIEEELDVQTENDVDNENEEDTTTYVDQIEPSMGWTKKRLDMAAAMWANANAH